MIDFLLPSLGADMDKAKLVMWLVSPGDEVHKGQIIAEVETDKATLEVECWNEGVIDELVVSPGPEKLPVGTLLARIRSQGEASAPEPALIPELEGAPAAEPAQAHHEPAPPIRHLAHQLGVDLSRVQGTGGDGLITREDVQSAALAVRPPARAPVVTGPGRVKRVSPRARALAVELGVDFDSIAGTGPDGLVVARDIESASTTVTPPTRLVGPGELTVSAQAEPPDVDLEEPEDKHEAMRRAISRSMSHSKREIPHYYLATHIDLDRAMTWLDARNEERPITGRVLPAALLLKATAVALRETPDLNGHFIDDRFRPSDAIHLGVAVSLREGGLVAPAIHHADQLDLDEMMARLRDLVNRARAWRLRSSEMSDPTITVTNLGDRGVETAFPVIIPPQVAIVGFGKVVEMPVVVEGATVVHPVVHATLAGDHRVTDGHRGGLFLDALDRLLQEPESL
jgi:pyruvate dehydrogenase E2 component (dihydrolipoamide acetyltransferase)